MTTILIEVVQFICCILLFTTTVWEILNHRRIKWVCKRERRFSLIFKSFVSIAACIGLADFMHINATYTLILVGATIYCVHSFYKTYKWIKGYEHKN